MIGSPHAYSAEPPAGISLSVPATRAIHQSQSSAEIEADAGYPENPKIRSVHIYQNVGTMVIEGQAMETFIQERIEWASKKYTLFQGIAFSTHDFYVYWLYCSEEKGANFIYYESPKSPKMEGVFIKGTCSSSSTRTDHHVQMPEIQLPSLHPIEGFEVRGGNLQLLSGKTGTFSVYDLKSAGFKKFEFLPFAVVDCTKCGDEKTAGWYELHSMIWNADRSEVHFGIFYLNLDERNRVELHYSLGFPKLDHVFQGKRFLATWSEALASTPIK